MEETYEKEFTPDKKDWKNLDTFLSKINIGYPFLDLDIFAKKALGASMNFYIGNKNYMVMAKGSEYGFGLKEDLKFFDHLIHVDIRIYKTKTLFSKKRYAVYISLISNKKEEKKKYKCCYERITREFPRYRNDIRNNC